jgi:undecaprenyl-diphosphatase
MEHFLALDRSLFLFINHLPHTDFTNTIASVLSGIGQWGLVWLVIAVYLFFREERRDHWFFLPFILCLAMVWLLSETIIKSLVLRPRPGLDIGALIISATGNYSFPSTHATLAFAMAYILSQEEPKLIAWFYILAGLIGLSRIYLGVHYPVDVIAGAFLGLGIGYVAKKIPPGVTK